MLWWNRRKSPSQSSENITPIPAFPIDTEPLLRLGPARPHQINNWKIGLAVFGGTISPVATFMLSQYLTARGFVSIPFARLLLVGADLLISILVVLVVKAFEIKRPVIVCGTVILFITSILGGLEMWATLSERTPEMKLQEQTVQSPKPVTLRQLFENGWPNLIGIYDVTMVSTSSRRRPDVEISWRLNGDFTSRSRFLEFFLRDAVAPKDAVDICKVIAENYQFFINEADLNVDIIGQWPGDTEVTHMRDMVFSRRIYIYYGNPDFSMEQKGILESICKKYNLAVEFRGSDYEQLHFLDHLELRPKPLTPHSVLLPKASVPGPRITVHNLSSQKPVEGIIDNPLRKRQIKYLTNHDV